MARPGEVQHSRASTFYILAGLAAVLHVILILAGSGAFILALTTPLPFFVAALVISGTIAWAAGGMLAQQQVFFQPPSPQSAQPAPPTFGAGATQNRAAPRWTNDES